MKKSYLMIAAAASLLTACGNQSMYNDFNEEPAEIAFETFAEKQTRADAAENSGVENTSTLNGHHETFKVWGSKVATTAQAVYDESSPGVVTYSSSAWSASPKKFWDKSASNYYFFAAAPSSPSWSFVFSSDKTDGTISLSNYKLTGVNVCTAASTTAITSWKTNGGADLDLMIASPCPVARTSYNTATPSKVTLNFNHILSRLNVLVQKGSNIASSKVSLIELKVYNMKNKGSFNEKPENLTSAQLSTGTIARWASTSSPSTDGTYVPSAIALSASSSSDGVTTTPKYVLETLIIPQNITHEVIDTDGSTEESQAYVYLKYSIDDEVFYGSYNLAAAFGATASSTTIPFNEGWQNNLTITINPASIEFDANVFDWATYATAGDITAQ